MKKQPVDEKKMASVLNTENSKKIISHIRRSLDADLQITKYEDFYDQFSKPTHSPAWDFFERIKAEKSNVQFDTPSQILEFNLWNSKYKWMLAQNTQQLNEAIKRSESVDGLVRKIREAKIRDRRSRFLKGLSEDAFGGYGFATDNIDETSLNNPQAIASFPVKQEFSPLLGTPFYKQMYLYDYLLMHSKCFYFKNYSGLAKNIVDNVRNFVIGRGYSVSIDNDKAKEVWERYEERSNIKIELRNWVDELTTFGEIFLKRVFEPEGIVHRSIDPSTIWEIVTDPENITGSGIKYYHQQYSTQYQLYSAKDAPISKYIINQIPPEQIIHIKTNITSYEKRGRSDLLAAILYFKYFEDYTTFKLLRVKNEAAFLWDVTVKGDESDVQSYINSTSQIVDVPPGSENVHNEAVERKPLAPAFSHGSSDDVIKWIVSYVAMSVNMPVNYLGTFESGGSGTRAGALVATEPVIRKFDERRTLIENLMNKIFDDVMVDAGIDPTKVHREFNFPEFINEDRSKKLQDLIVCKDENFITHERAATIAAKELNITNYEYEVEMDAIREERSSEMDILTPMSDPDQQAGQDLTKTGPGEDTQDNRAFDRSAVRQQHKTI